MRKKIACPILILLSLSLTLAFIHTTYKLFPIFKLGGPEVIYTRRGVLCACVKKIKRTRTPNRTRAITSIGIPLIYSYLFSFFLFLLHRNDGALVRGANELFRDLLLFFFSFHSLPAPPPLDIRRRFGCFIYFVPERVARSGCPARRDIKHGVKATFSLFLNGWIMQTTKKENFQT